MRYKVLTIRDRAADVFSQPFFSQSIGAAIRGFGDEVKRDGSNINKHPEDYDLYHIADFDDETGGFEVVARPIQVAIGKDFA